MITIAPCFRSLASFSGAGLGMFSILALPGLHQLHEWPADIILPMLKERTMRDNDSKTEDPTNAGESRNARKGNKKNKTGENKIKKRQGKQE